MMRIGMSLQIVSRHLLQGKRLWVLDLDTEAWKARAPDQCGIGHTCSLLASDNAYACCAPGTLAGCRPSVAALLLHDLINSRIQQGKHCTAYRFRVPDKRALREPLQANARQ